MGSQAKRKGNMAESKVPVTMRDFFFDDPFFKRSWDDFDKVRDAMFNESRDMWKRFDEDFRDSACMKNNIMLEPGMELGKEARRKPEARLDKTAKLVTRRVGCSREGGCSPPSTLRSSSWTCSTARTAS